MTLIGRIKFALLLPFFQVSLACSSFPLQIQHAATSIITAWWWFKPDSAFTLTTEVSAAPLAPVLRKHTPTHFKRTTSAGDAATLCGNVEHGLILSLQKIN